MSVMERVVYVMEGVVCVTAPFFYYQLINNKGVAHGINNKFHEEDVNLLDAIIRHAYSLKVSDTEEERDARERQHLQLSVAYLRGI